MIYKNILLVDDDEDDHEIFATALRELSPLFNFSSASDGRRVLQQLDSKQISPDLIFLDLNMPLMDGRLFLKTIRSDKNTPAIPIIIFSTSSDPGTISQVMALGAQRFITKPDKFNQLKDLLRNLLF